MNKWRVCLVATAVAFCGLILSPGITRADELTGTVGISWISGVSTFASDTIAVGSSLSCPGTSPICNGYSDGFVQLGDETFSVGTSSISYSGSNYSLEGGNYGSTTSFDFTGLNFASGEPLSGFTIASESGITLTDADFTIGPGGSSISIDLAGLPIDSSFTIDLIPSSTTVAAPEPSSLMLLGLGLIALVGLARKRFGSERFAVGSAS